MLLLKTVTHETAALTKLVCVCILSISVCVCVCVRCNGPLSPSAARALVTNKAMERSVEDARSPSCTMVLSTAHALPQRIVSGSGARTKPTLISPLPSGATVARASARSGPLRMVVSVLPSRVMDPLPPTGVPRLV